MSENDDDHTDHVHVRPNWMGPDDSVVVAAVDSAFRSGGQTHETGPRPHLSTPQPRLVPPEVDNFNRVGVRQSMDQYAHSQEKINAMAYRLVAVSLMMKSQHQLAGLVVAREYCNEHNLDLYEIESELREKGTPFGRSGLQVDATENGEAWFWRGRRQP